MQESLPLEPHLQQYLATRNHQERHLSFEKHVVPVREHLSPALKDAAEKLQDMSNKLNPVELYTPEKDIRDKEKATFIEAFERGDIYQPQFSYKNAEDIDYEGQQRKLYDIISDIHRYEPQNEAERLARIALNANAKDTMATLQLAEGIQKKDERLIKTAMHQKYPAVDAWLLDIAQKEYEKRARGERDVVTPGDLSADEQEYLMKKRLNAEDIAEAFIWALKQYNMYRENDQDGPGFRVRIDQQATAIDVRDKSSEGPIIVIPSHRNDNAAKILSLISHEIEGHARQAMNGKRLFDLGRSDEETLYEGLAMRLEDAFMSKHFGNRSMPSPYYVLAIQKADTGGSFYDVFQDCLERELHVALQIPVNEPLPSKDTINPEKYNKAMTNAWSTAYRVMCGHTDMSNPAGYAMRKDAAYLRGYFMDQQLRDQHLSHLNEANIISLDGLQLLARLKIDENDIPIPYQDVATQYMQMMLAKRDMEMPQS